MIVHYCWFVIFLFTSALSAQKNDYAIQLIPDSLKVNANAVVRFEQIDIIISTQRNMTIKTKRVVTVLNEYGINAIQATESYDKATSIRNVEGIVYDAYGNEIKKIKRKDFRDQSAVDGGTLASDSRYIYLDYTPVKYPFTFEFISEVSTSTTAFIPQWMPINSYFVSVEKCVLNVSFPENLGFKKKESGFSNFNIQKTEDDAQHLKYVAVNFPAQKREDYSQSTYNIFPRVMMGLEYFNLQGVDGNAKTWGEFGKWWSDKILAGTEEIPEETKLKMRTLVGDEKDSIAKAKIIYKYVQEKVRYVSIQEGIGGWKPMLAKDVDRLGYGDCKALSNYTKALLKAVGVTSYYTKLYGDNYKKDIISDFVSQQGNHIILAIPTANKYIFLECTSQDDPFGYQGTFTDDRDVLIIKPEGGEIVHTTIYSDLNNSQISKGKYTIAENGDFAGTIKITSQGSQYSRKVGLEKALPTDQEKHYKEYWDNINSLKIDKIAYSNDKEKVIFTEDSNISGGHYATISGNKMLFPVNLYNKNTTAIKRMRNRKNAFEISRGYYDNDEIEIELPEVYTIEFLPQNIEIKSKFGDYKTEIIKKDDHKIIYKRSMLLKKGLYTNTDYEDYRLYMDKLTRNDNAKIILIKT